MILPLSAVPLYSQTETINSLITEPPKTTLSAHTGLNTGSGIRSSRMFKNSRLYQAVNKGLTVLIPAVLITLTATACSSSQEETAKIEETNTSSALSLQEHQSPLSPSSWFEPEGEHDFSSEEQARKLALKQGLDWITPFTPYTGSESRIYGSTGLGCLSGAEALTEQGNDLQLQRWGKNRNYAHPLMLQYLNDLSARTRELGLPPLLIGDLGLQYGGPFGPASNHASHNTGIDVDLPFDFARPRKSTAELYHPKDVYIVKGRQLKSAFTPDIALYIRTAASDPRVDRIFVAPRIKERMCELYENQPGDGFLRKLRPWFGHQAHMHVRLKCPADSPDCTPQAPIPEGTGCGYEVASWYLPPPVLSKEEKAAQAAKAKERARNRVFPQKCSLLFQNYQTSPH